MLYGLIGYPLGHSFSKQFFSEKFEKENIPAQYHLYPIESIHDFQTLIEENEFVGLNVTIPYKEQIIAFLDELDSTAAVIGAVNVIHFQKGKSKQPYLKGYNTDAIGFRHSLLPYLKPYHRHALILGTGGASKAVNYVLQQQGITTTFVSRTPNKDQLTYAELNQTLMEKNTLIVNCTPTGMYPNIHECPNIPYPFIGEKHLLYDVVYRPEETLFLQKGKEQGATILNGMEMLFGQANAAWNIWNDSL